MFYASYSSLFHVHKQARRVSAFSEMVFYTNTSLRCAYNSPGINFNMFPMCSCLSKSRISFPCEKCVCLVGRHRVLNSSILNIFSLFGVRHNRRCLVFSFFYFALGRNISLDVDENFSSSSSPLTSFLFSLLSGLGDVSKHATD